MKKLILLMLVLVVITGCATPAATLKNYSTGQVVRCGGDSTGFMMGGMIGYSVEKNNAEKCVMDYEAQGFRRVK